MYSIIINISNKALLEECEKEQNVAVTGAATASFSKGRRQNVLSNVTCSPSHRQAKATIINVQSTLRTVPDLCKNVSHAVVLGSDGNAYTFFTQADVCVCVCVYIYICTYSSQYGDAGRAKKKKNWDNRECRVRYVRQPYSREIPRVLWSPNVDYLVH